MRTKDFLEALRASAERELVFSTAEGVAVHRGYHLTEIKAVAYDTVDCGGQKNRWNETILQLWVPEGADDEYMKAGKFVKIFDSVCAAIPVQEAADVRIEYGDDRIFPSVYTVTEVSADGNALNVTLEPPETTCKARNRRITAKQECSCC